MISLKLLTSFNKCGWFSWIKEKVAVVPSRLEAILNRLNHTLPIAITLSSGLNLDADYDEEEGIRKVSEMFIVSKEVL